MALPAVDHRPAQTPVGDQCDRQTCVAFAVTAAHEWMAGDGGTLLSQEFAQWAGKSRDGLPGDATSARWILSGLQEEGHARGSTWPYGAPEWPAGPPPAALIQADRLVLGRWRRLAAPDVTTIADEVAQGFSVILTVAFVPNAWLNLADGSLIDAPPGQRTIGGHAVTVVGIRPADGSLPDALIVKNSWGPDWGDAGFGMLSVDYLGSYGIVAHALEAL